ncbi:MAG: GNAT family N-acetyltransferase [Bacteroidia bacterium]
MNYRNGSLNDLADLTKLAQKSWQKFQQELAPEHWQKLSSVVSSEQTFSNLLAIAPCFVCETEANELVGMAFIVPSGNPADVFEKEWAVIRFVSVHPYFAGQGIGKHLTMMCIDWAKQNNEKTIALHTSEMMQNARHIYEHLGFRILKELEPRLGKKYWLYTLDL